MNIDIPVVVAVCSCVTVAGFVIGTFVRGDRRVTEIKGTANAALQTAAENEEGIKAIGRHLVEIARDAKQDTESARLEIGETVRAMQAKIHEIGTWSRDEFVRKHSFEQAFDRAEKAQVVRDDRLDKRLDRIEKKLDDATAALSQ